MALITLTCVECSLEYDADANRTRCDCGGLLDVSLGEPASVDRALFDQRMMSWAAPDSSGVWRYREWLPPFEASHIVSKPEGNTNLYDVPELARWAGVDQLWLKHEGENPTGSFKDRGMTVATSHAMRTRATMVACASTGNTSASVAAYAAAASVPAIVFVPDGKISAAKLGQTVAYGAKIIQIRGDFDAAMTLVQQASSELGIYLLNSINPYRLEGQKSILFEMLHQLGWEAPDWVILPGGNLGNSSALGKAFAELKQTGVLGRLPRMGVIQAEGASPFYEAFRSSFRAFEPMEAHTVASAIQIGNPVSYTKAKRAIELTDGVVEIVTDDEILDAKARIDQAGIGCEPASAATLAGLRKLVQTGVVSTGDRVAGVLTGHLMKDAEVVMEYHLGAGSDQRPLANKPVVIEPTIDALRGVLTHEL
ncbi:MAG: threonine synthase [Thermomicrobiaceae bacterium]